jgi:hypothetical protein
MPEANAAFYAKHGIKLYQYGVPGNKEPFVDIPEDKVRHYDIFANAQTCSVSCLQIEFGFV